MQTKLILIVTLVGLAVLFIMQNVAVVEVRFLFWNMSMSRALLMLLLLVLGIITGWVLHSYLMHRRKHNKN